MTSQTYTYLCNYEWIWEKVEFTYQYGPEETKRVTAMSHCLYVYLLTNDMMFDIHCTDISPKGVH